MMRPDEYDEYSDIFAEGVLETRTEGDGFLRSPDYGYRPGPDDIYVSRFLIQVFHLKNGDAIAGRVRTPRRGETHFSLVEIETVNSESPFGKS